MKNKNDKRIHAQQITSFFSSVIMSKKVKLQKTNKTSLHTLNVY